MQPLISIITPSYNKEKYITETINSVLEQTFTEFEMIIVDDLSTDRTIQIVRSFQEQDKRIKLFINPSNKGANYSRNFALKEAKGDYIMFLDADDVLLPHCLKERLKNLDLYPEKNVLIFSMGIFKVQVGDDERKWIADSKTPLKDFLAHNIPWQTMQPIWEKGFIKRLGGFDENFKRMQDVELHTRALLHRGLEYKIISGPLDCYYRIDDTRKNFNINDFLTRWVESAVNYCEKFKTLVPLSDLHYLKGTIYQAYFQVIYHYKMKQISDEQFIVLERRLLSGAFIKELNFAKRALFGLSKYYNLYFFRIPGFNRFLKWLIIA